ncbi:flagellar filament capping protein FliD [Marinomonas gallaica]|uniref:flagellar filament capping protein FliD n=1 Tax=Marinomonas gallaica TaxID=1806667 RepID=UPI003CE51574
MSVTSLGVGSGIDLESLVSNMVKVQRDARVSSYNESISDYKSEVSAYGKLKSTLEAFEESVEKLSDSKLFTGRTAETTQPTSGDIISVEADKTSSNGSYNISVSQLAQGSRSLSAAGAFSSPDDVVSANGGQLKYTSGDEEFTIDVAAGTTLKELREQINGADDNFGISANLVDDGTGNVFLALTSDKSGAGNDLVVENVSGDAALASVSSDLSISADDAAKDAIINVDGIDIRSDTNTFEGAISGLTIKALNISAVSDSGVPEKAKTSVNYDTETVKETLNSFIESYNNLQTLFESQTKIGGPLNGSSLIRGLEGALNSDLMTTFDNAGDLSTIFDIGIEMDNDGKLSLDDTKFSDAMDNSYDDLTTLFSGDNGLASVMEEFVGSYTGSGGMLKDLVDSSQSSVKATEKQLENYEYRMVQYEERLRARFTQLDVSLASMKSNGNYLLNQLGSMNTNSQ